MGKPSVLLALALAVFVTTSAQDAPVSPTLDSWLVIKGPEDGGSTVVATGLQFAGQPLSVSAASTVDDCAAACRSNASCQWFNWRRVEQVEQRQQQETQQCTLLGGACALAPRIAGQEPNATAGFPLRLPADLDVPGFSTEPGRGIMSGGLGGDVTCGASLIPGRCALARSIDAARLCTSKPDCLSVVVYENGTDGCSAPVSILQARPLAESNDFASPSTYTLVKDSSQLLTLYLHPGEAHVVAAPSDEQLAAAGVFDMPTEELANSSTWLGCIVAEGVAMDGIEVQLLDNLPSAEECCRQCRQALPGADGRPCNAWTYCAQPGGCRFTTSDGDLISLRTSQCSLRHQSKVDFAVGWPPRVLAKGPSVPFIGGSPLTTAGPPIPGYRRYLGLAMFARNGFPCNESLKPEIEECIVPMPKDDLALPCEQYTQCTGFTARTAGIYNVPGPLAALKLGEPTNDSLTFVPSAIFYQQESSPPVPAADTAPTSSSSSLSGGAIAGIAVGAAAATAAAAAAALLLLRPRRRRRSPAGGGGTARKPAPSDEADLVEGGKPCKGPELDKGSSGSGCGSSGGMAAGGSSGATPAAITPAASASRLVVLRSVTVTSPQPSTRMPWSSHPPPSLATSPSSPVDVKPPPLQQPLGAGTPVPLREVALQLEALSSGGGTSLSSSGSSFGRWAAGLPGEPHAASAAASADDAGADCGSELGDLPPSLREWVIDPAAVSFMRGRDGRLMELGHGASGRVFRASFRGEPVAAKVVDLAGSSAAHFVREAAALAALRHPAVVGFFGVSLIRGRGVLVMELMEGRDLSGALQLTAPGGGERLYGWYCRGWRCAYDVAKALNFLHSKSIVHMDVKSGNTLLTSRGPGGAAKLADVALSRLQTRTFLSDVPLVGTFAWVAPEVLMGGSQCTLAIDVYSYGVLLWEIITGERPVRGHMRQPRVPQECPQAAADLLADCVQLEPGLRPTAQQLLQRLERMAPPQPAAADS